MNAYFPPELCTAIIRPILKKPTLSPSSLANFRPISSLPFLSKIIEKSLLSYLQPFLFASPFFPRNQSAYRPGYSTETALLSVLNDLYSFIDHNQAALMLSLDLSAAFDLLNHDILLRRLEYMFGLSTSFISLLRSYLAFRSFVVDCDGLISAPHKLSFGVPQ
jgi:hypothetical protein